MKASEKKVFLEAMKAYSLPKLRKRAAATAKMVEFLRAGWCQEAEAENERGEWVYPKSKSAVSWCWCGAQQKAGLYMFDEMIDHAVGAIVDPKYFDGIDYNEAKGRTQREVVALAKKVNNLFVVAVDQRSKKAKA